MGAVATSIVSSTCTSIVMISSPDNSNSVYAYYSSNESILLYPYF